MFQSSTRCVLFPKKDTISKGVFRNPVAGWDSIFRNPFQRCLAQHLVDGLNGTLARLCQKGNRRGTELPLSCGFHHFETYPNGAPLNPPTERVWAKSLGRSNCDFAKVVVFHQTNIPHFGLDTFLNSGFKLETARRRNQPFRPGFSCFAPWACFSQPSTGLLSFDAWCFPTSQGAKGRTSTWTGLKGVCAHSLPVFLARLGLFSRRCKPDAADADCSWYKCEAAGRAAKT